ncbi:MAG: iron-sulfur cluster assembly scaffold protein [Candidatus Thermoplasmatota archaeon]|jgi:nitrogen fixation NifU-like protein|nr:iron-sulfur cluster assembly scaffold protein [Candidatus Thermoplasmatota archaeon]
MKIEYTKIVKDHFYNPRNVGEIKDANGIGTVGSKTCGDVMTIYLRIEKKIIKDISFKTYGCAAAIASGSIATEIAKGMKIQDAMGLTREDIAKKLGGLPEFKMHCSNLAADAIHKAIKDYTKKLKE